MSGARSQTTLDSFFEKIETVSNCVEDKIAILYGELRAMGREVNNLMLKFNFFIGTFGQKFEEIKSEFKALKESLR